MDAKCEVVQGGSWECGKPALWNLRFIGYTLICCRAHMEHMAFESLRVNETVIATRLEEK